MPYIVYILYSSSRDKYYIGSTGDDLSERLRRHNSNHAGFTGKGNDWILVYKMEYQDKATALKMEKLIKSWKSRKKILALISSPK